MPEVAILTQVSAGRAGALRRLLRDLPGPRADIGRAGPADPAQAQLSPFAGRGTHFARFVVVDIGKPHLVFSSRFDGDREDYLGALAEVPRAVSIWGHCELPRPVSARTLRGYLLSGRDRVEASYVIAVCQATTTVSQINRALELRAAISSFASAHESSDAVTLAHCFRQLEQVRELAGT